MGRGPSDLRAGSFRTSDGFRTSDVDMGKTANQREDKAKKFQASGRGTTALAAVLPRHGTTARTTARTTAGNRRCYGSDYGSSHGTTAPQYYRANHGTTVLPTRRNGPRPMYP